MMDTAFNNTKVQRDIITESWSADQEGLETLDGSQNRAQG